jgi:Tfp pilus assembly protein PilF
MKPAPQGSARLQEAVRLQQIGAPAQAESICREVLAADADSADAWNLLAIALAGQSQLDAAAEAAGRATALRPKIAQYWLTLGTIEEGRGDENAAQAAFREAGKLGPRLAEAHYGLAQSLHRENRLEEAAMAYRDALRGNPGAAEIYYGLARALLWSGRWHEAMEAFHEAFSRDPKATLDRRECMDWFRDLRFESLPEEWHAEVTRFFRREDIDKSRYVAAGVNVLLARPEFAALRAAADSPAPFAPSRAALEQAMRNELFGILLRETLIASSAIEALLTRLRRALLLDEALRAAAPLEFLCDLALQCLHNEFVYPEDEAEGAQLASLAREAEARLGGARAVDEDSMRVLATLALYRPLHALTRAGDLLALAPAHAAFDRLLRRSVREVLEERRLREGIRAIGAIRDPVSAQVRAQYEENPYPRWLALERATPGP